MTQTTEAPAEEVTVTLDGRLVTARKGEMIISAAERAGVYIPRFCYHPRMRSVGMCRMCLVEVKGPRGFSLQPACFVAVADGQEVVTTSVKVAKAQHGVLEFLLANHPLDCPVCDKGGECPLQDQTLTYGPGESRFVEEKRHFAKPIYISDLVALDRERCIQCDRCTRFADDVAGDPLIQFIGRGDQIQINTFPDRPFASYFSGNTVQICPVGALTAKPYRFRARPWDVEQVESTCTWCSVGCRMAVQSSSNRLTRYLGIDSDPVNQSWLCDKGRFGFEAVNSDSRVTRPLVRRGGELVEASWPEALEAAATGLAEVSRRQGPGAIGVIGGARLANEDAYAWAKLAKAVIGTDSVDAQLGDGLPAEVVLGLPRATIDQACSARTVVLLAPDLREELPVLFLRLRGAVREGQVKVVELTPAATAMTALATVSLTYRPGEVAALAREVVSGSGRGSDVAALVDGDGEGVVVVLGRPSLADSAAAMAETAGVLAEALPSARFLPALRRANVMGALDMGLAPGVLPGRVSLEAGAAWWSEEWGSVPSERGLDCAGMLAATARGDMGALVLLGADPLSDFPDRRLASEALGGDGFVVAVDAFLTDSSRQADVVLPAATYAERPGTTTNLEGRISRLAQKLVPPGVARADWMIAVELALALGADLGLGEVESIWDEIERLVPSHVGITRSVLTAAWAADGVVAPLSIGLVHLGQPTRSLDPMATPGIGAVRRHGPTQGQGVVGPAKTHPAASAGEGEPDGPEPVRPRRPALMRFDPGPAGAEVPRLDGYSLRLVSGRTLYDHGTLVQACPSLAPLAPPGVLRANPYDTDRLGIGTGDQVRVRSPRASFVTTVETTPLVPRGVAAMAFNVDDDGGHRVSELIDATASVTDIRLDTP
ncbi:MAG: NADH dehydrogenase (quinone) subunit G [Acidimicrobiales bacterium]|nr:MAG: NADH dehydrogenase (quinone) subunit G [Acidimicrobiales bacterium]